MIPKAKDSTPKASKSAGSQIIVGRASGKRRLMGLMDDNLATKRKRLLEIDERENVPSPVLSRFFGNNAIAGPSRPGPTPGDDGVLDTQEVVLVTDFGDVEEEEVEDADAPEEEPSQVVQEDGYLSPAPSLKRLSTPDLSSPPRPLEPSRVFCCDSSTQDFAVDTLSSPETRKPVLPLRSKSLSNRENRMPGRILFPDTPRKSGPVCTTNCTGAELLCGPNLFEDADTAEIDDVTMPPCSFGGSTQSSSGLDTPVSQEASGVVTCEEEPDLGDDIEFIEMRRAKQDAVAQGWWSKWAREGASDRTTTKDPSRHRKYTPLRRRETTVTPDGLHGALRFWPNANADGEKKAQTNRVATRPRGSARTSYIRSESAHEVEIIRRRRSTGMAESSISVVG
ncbi:hypothetical protein BJV78DRAFT_1214211 [Lactifluus subvellereus]|nr:hypothetical protein BJV78DRAFT_1214211 [Lactifluus subvellereus]